jgi:hypothetical protein
MAQLKVDGDELILRLSLLEKAEAMHGNLRSPLSKVKAVEVLDDAYAPAGIRSGVRVGMRIPGHVIVGRVIGIKNRIFAAVHNNTPRGVRVTFTDNPNRAWIVGCPNPEDVAASIPVKSPTPQ